jgi:hypothetical protein
MGWEVEGAVSDDQSYEDMTADGVILEQLLTSVHEQRTALEDLVNYVKGLGVNLEAVRLAQVSVGTALAQLTEICSRRPARCAAILSGVTYPGPGGDGGTEENGWPPEER